MTNKIKLSSPEVSKALSSIQFSLPLQKKQELFDVLRETYKKSGQKATVSDLPSSWVNAVEKYLVSAKKTFEADLTKENSHERKVKALASKHKTAIEAALAASITGVSAAISHAVNTSTMLDAPMAAKQAVDAYINFDSAQSVKTLQSLYTVALDAGAKAEAKTLGADAILGPRSAQQQYLMFKLRLGRCRGARFHVTDNAHSFL